MIRLTYQRDIINLRQYSVTFTRNISPFLFICHTQYCKTKLCQGPVNSLTIFRSPLHEVYHRCQVLHVIPRYRSVSMAITSRCHDYIAAKVRGETDGPSDQPYMYREVERCLQKVHGGFVKLGTSIFRVNRWWRL